MRGLPNEAEAVCAARGQHRPTRMSRASGVRRNATARRTWRLVEAFTSSRKGYARKAGVSTSCGTTSVLSRTRGQAVGVNCDL